VWWVSLRNSSHALVVVFTHQPAERSSHSDLFPSFLIFHQFLGSSARKKGGKAPQVGALSENGAAGATAGMCLSDIGPGLHCCTFTLQVGRINTMVAQESVLLCMFLVQNRVLGFFWLAETGQSAFFQLLIAALMRLLSSSVWSSRHLLHRLLLPLWLRGSSGETRQWACKNLLHLLHLHYFFMKH